MKFAVLLALAVCIGSSSAGWISDTTNVISQTAVNTVKVPISIANVAENVVSSAKDKTVNIASAAKNMTVNTIFTGVELAKNVTLSSINLSVDTFFSVINKSLKSKGKLSLPPISMSKMGMTFNATKGSFSDLATMKKAGPINAYMNGSWMIMEIPMKIEDIDIKYGLFNVSANLWLTSLHFSGGIDIHVGDDAITIIMASDLKPGLHCALNIKKVIVTILKGITVKFHDMGKKSDAFMNKMSEWIITCIKEKIKQNVQSSIDDALKSYLKENGSLCNLFLG